MATIQTSEPAANQSMANPSKQLFLIKHFQRLPNALPPTNPPAQTLSGRHLRRFSFPPASRLLCFIQQMYKLKGISALPH